MQYLKILSVILLLTANAGCFHKSADDLFQDRAVNAALEASNRTIQYQTLQVYNAISSRLTDPVTKFRAEIWSPKADRIRKVSEDCCNFLEHLKDDLKAASGIGDTWKGDSAIDSSLKSTADFFGSGEKEKVLINTLKKYEADLLNTDEGIKKQFENTLRYTNIENSSTNTHVISFKNISVSKALLLLNLIQNNVRVNENNLVMFCLSKIPAGGCGYSLGPFFITSQNSSYVKPGGQFEITAGMGAFTIQGEPTIFINGKNVGLNSEGVAISKIKAATKPGKYHVPVSITYADENGMKRMKERTIEYIVADTSK